MTETTAGTAAADIVSVAEGLIPLIDSHAASAEARGSLAEEVVEALHETGLWGMWVPSVLGGAELDPVASLDVLQHISYADASTGWVLMAAALATGVDAAYLPDEAVEQLFAGERLLVHAGQGTRAGRGTQAEGGYLLSGEWAFASGLKHSQVLHTGMLVQETGEVRIAVFPVEQANVIDNWNVMGLRATGSIDYTTDGLFVPEGWTFNATTETPLRGGALYTLGIVNIACICHSAWALGVGRRLLDELRALVEQKSGRPGSLGENDAFLGEFAMAEAKWRAAHALTHGYWRENEETLRRGEKLSLEQETLNRMALQYVTWTVEEVAMFVYASAGTTALREGTIQRFFRDMHAGTQHMTSSSPVRQACGRMLAGAAPGKRWMFMSLVDGD
jgi:alkylation response protein AidB-like acyl-CoA dehydrogenase